MRISLYALSLGVLATLLVGCTVTKTTLAPQKEPAAVALQPQATSITSPVVAAPAATPAQLVGANGVILWNFETNTTGGWHGNESWSSAIAVNADPVFVKEGKYSLKLNAKGSNGWNQDLAVNEGPFPTEFSKLKSITMDVYVPKESIEGLPYVELFLVVSGAANSWYQIKQEIKEGWNSIEFPIDTDNVNGDIWQVYLILNSSQEFTGPIYIDNVIGKY